MPATKIRILINIAGGLLAAVIIGYFVVSAINKADNSPTKLLSLGEKYLTELKYEEALVQFLKVIEIEPMNERAYLAAAEAYIGLGQTDKAIEVLEKGLLALPDSVEIKAKMEELQPPPPEPELEPEPEPGIEPESETEPEPEPEPELESESESESEPGPVSEEAASVSQQRQGSVTVVGRIINNEDEYNDKWMAYIEQHWSSDSTGTTSVRMLGGLAVRFEPGVEVHISGNTVVIREAVLTYRNASDPDRLSKLIGAPVKLTGQFMLTRQTKEFDGPYDDGDYGSYYLYRPNGDYEFLLESFEELR